MAAFVFGARPAAVFEEGSYHGSLLNVVKHRELSPWCDEKAFCSAFPWRWGFCSPSCWGRLRGSLFLTTPTLGVAARAFKSVSLNHPVCKEKGGRERRKGRRERGGEGREGERPTLAGQSGALQLAYTESSKPLCLGKKGFAGKACCCSRNVKIFPSRIVPLPNCKDRQWACQSSLPFAR